MIIIEGLDATGKSTLAARISELLGWPIQSSEGPEKYPGEIVRRSEQYLNLPNHTIFDRHPLISQFVYGSLANKTLPPMYLLQELKRRNPYIIEAHPGNHGDHIVKAHDNPEHLDMITKKRNTLHRLYQEFFRLHFPLRYVYTFDRLEETAQSATSYVRRNTDEDPATLNGRH